MRLGRRTVFVLAGGAVLLAAALAGWTTARGASADVPLYVVEEQSFKRIVRAEGHLEAVRATPITVPALVRRPYQIAELAPEGTLVEEGQIVLRFDPTELESSAEEALNQQRTTDLRIAKQSTEAASAARNLARDAELASDELDSARTFQKRDAMIFSRFEIAESEIDAELAEKRRSHAEASGQSKRALAQSELEILTLERQHRATELERAMKALGLLEVAAPHSGIFIVERDWRGNRMRVGNSVFSGQKVAEIPDLSAMQAEVFVLEADAGGLEVGQPARVIVESRPGAVYQAEVQRVDTLAQPRLPGSPVQFFGATLELETTEPEYMKPGQRVRAEIVLSNIDSAVVVPRQAIVETDGSHVVFRRRGRGFEKIPVTLGAAGLGRVVVESGLEPGDVIAAREPGLGQSALEDSETPAESALDQATGGS